MERKNSPVVFYDGVCNLCHWFVQFVLKYEKRSILKFSHLQSDIAASYLLSSDRQSNNYKTVILFDGTKYYRRSSAVVRILWYMGSYWIFIGGVLWCIPLPIRDLVYIIIAKLRYQFFGKQDTCYQPVSKDRFI